MLGLKIREMELVVLIDLITIIIIIKSMVVLTINDSMAKAYFITPTNSLTFPKPEECSAVKQNFTSFMG